MLQEAWICNDQKGWGSTQTGCKLGLPWNSQYSRWRKKKKKKESISKVPWQQPAKRFLLALPSHVTGPFPRVCQPRLTVRAPRSCTASDYTEQTATETHNPTHTGKKEKKKGLLVTSGLTLEQTQTGLPAALGPGNTPLVAQQDGTLLI